MSTGYLVHVSNDLGDKMNDNNITDMQRHNVWYWLGVASVPVVAAVGAIYAAGEIVWDIVREGISEGFKERHNSDEW